MNPPRKQKKLIPAENVFFNAKGAAASRVWLSHIRMKKHFSDSYNEEHSVVFTQRAFHTYFTATVL